MDIGVEAFTNKFNAYNNSCAVQVSIRAARFSAVILSFFGMVFACNFLYTLLKLVRLPRIISEFTVIPLPRTLCKLFPRYYPIFTATVRSGTGPSYTNFHQGYV